MNFPIYNSPRISMRVVAADDSDVHLALVFKNNFIRFPPDIAAECSEKDDSQYIYHVKVYHTAEQQPIDPESVSKDMTNYGRVIAGLLGGELALVSWTPTGRSRSPYVFKGTAFSGDQATEL